MEIPISFIKLNIIFVFSEPFSDDSLDDPTYSPNNHVSGIFLYDNFIGIMITFVTAFLCIDFRKN